MKFYDFCRSFSGVQAILELFFKRFVFVCSKERAEEYGTIATNVFIALSLVTALTGGLLADYVVGNFHTQNISNMVAAVGVVMILVSSWQYTLNQPSCCTNNTYLCREFDRMTLPGRGIHIDPNVLVILILVGCAVSCGTIQCRWPINTIASCLPRGMDTPMPCRAFSLETNFQRSK